MWVPELRRSAPSSCGAQVCVQLMVLSLARCPRFNPAAGTIRDSGGREGPGTGTHRKHYGGVSSPIRLLDCASGRILSPLEKCLLGCRLGRPTFYSRNGIFARNLTPPSS